MNLKADYSYLDMMIQQRIAAGANTHRQIDGGEVYKQARWLSEATGREAFRIIDGRLQAMRKKGLIKYSTAEKWNIPHE